VTQAGQGGNADRFSSYLLASTQIHTLIFPFVGAHLQLASPSVKVVY